MRKFFYNDGEGDEDEEGEEGEEMLHSIGNFENTMDFIFSEMEFDRKLLVEVIRFLENSFFWKFRTHAKKLKMIKETYIVFIDILTAVDELKKINLPEEEGEDDDADL